MRSKQVFDPDHDYEAGVCPWTFFAFPASLARKDGLPLDDRVVQRIQELQQRGIHVGLWRNSPVQGTHYLACPVEQKDLLDLVLNELERLGLDGLKFLQGHCENSHAAFTPN